MKRRINHYASFKDPAAKVFYIESDEENIYRELAPSYLSNYHHFMSSGLANELIHKNFILPFEELKDINGSVVLKTRKIRFVSYPYEWTFNQWKDAALLTIKIQYHALKFGMTLKDATAFNIVFDGNKPLFIDLSSFEIFKPGQPWQAFKQFSENFYLPVLLVKYFNTTGNDIYLNNINGIPLNKGMQLLPAKAYFNFNTVLFLAMPGKIRNQLKEKQTKKSSKIFTIKSSLNLAGQLFSNISKLSQSKQQTKWNDYYDKNIDAAYLKEKENILKQWVDKNFTKKTLLDFGCNTGHFSKLLAAGVEKILAFDEDARSVDEFYDHCKKNNINNISCFTANLCQPTPATGWNNMERQALPERFRGELGLALALTHHLAISNHIQFTMMADLFANSCNELIIEFVPKDDAKVQLLLSDREDIFDWYNFSNFTDSFQTRFNLIKEHTFSNKRVLLHFIKRKDE